MVKALLVAVLFLARFQDSDTRALLRLEDDWARALVKRDTVVFQRLLASGFVYTEDDKTIDRATVLHEVGSGSDTVTAAHNEAMEVHRFGATALVHRMARCAGARLERIVRSSLSVYRHM